MGIFSAKKNDELVLVFNIRSSSVGGALFRSQGSGIPKIIFSTIEPILIEEKIDIDRYLFLTIQSLQIVSEKIYKAGMGAPRRIFCVLSSPWYVSQTRMIVLKKNTPFSFTEKLADSLVEKEINLFESEFAAKYDNKTDSIRTIELKNIRMMLNGYETPKPLNQKAKELEMTIFISMSEEKILTKIEDTITKYFHSSPIKFSSFALAAFTVVRDMNQHQENFLLVNIGGEVTDISMIKKSVLRESVSFPIGRNYLTRGVARGLGSTLSEANSLISLLKDGHAEASVDKKLVPILTELKSEWLKMFQQSLANLSNDISIPATIYLATDRELEIFFSETIMSEQFNQYTLTESKFEVIFLNTQIFHGIAAYEENVIRDPFLIIDSIYINRFLTNPIEAGQI